MQICFFVSVSESDSILHWKMKLNSRSKPAANGTGVAAYAIGFLPSLGITKKGLIFCMVLGVGLQILLSLALHNSFLSSHGEYATKYYSTSIDERKVEESRSRSKIGSERVVPAVLRQFETATDFTADRQFLVVCKKVANALYPTFSNFTVVRLIKKETPPPWNATVFLHIEKKCANHPYVVESKERRNRSPFLFSSNQSAYEMEHDYGSSLWVHGVHWPAFSANSTKYLRVIRDRPAIIGLMGEVFWRTVYEKTSCGNVDFVVYREVETPIPDCLTIHSLQGVSTTMIRGNDVEFGFRSTSKIFEKIVAHPHKPRDKVEYEKFCSFLVRYNSTSPAHMFNSTRYETDAFVRHMFFLQLSEYKPCERITDCPSGDPYTGFKCMVGYKFHITMENTLIDGYVSEKLFNGALGGGIPIYFGASDVGKYVNEKSFIHCDVSREVIDEMRLFYPRRPRQGDRPFLFNYSSSWPTDKELLSWADKYLRPQLDPCVKRVVELDSNDEDFMSVLNEPFILNKDIMSGVYPLKGVALAYNLLRNLDTGNDFVTVPERVTGKRPQKGPVGSNSFIKRQPKKRE